ncbi:MAG: PASTA domain-containing protein [Clostridia bacterium]
MSENKSFLDTVAQNNKPESFGLEKFEVVKDNKRGLKIISIIIIIALLFAGTFIVYNILNKVKVPELVGMSLTDASDWALKNRITLAIKGVYNFDQAENIVLTQEITAGESINKNSTMSIQVSLGADPEESITFPDIMNMSTSEIETWISDNKLTGAKLVTANSDVIAANQVISYTFTDGAEDNFKRKNRVTITVSIGSETLSATVVVGNFAAMKVGEVLQWGADNGVIISLQEAFDEYISAGNIISQSVKANTEINRTDGITVVISKGKSVIVPNFSSMTKDEANSWAKLNNIVLTILDRYSNANDKGRLYGQSLIAGSSIEEGKEIKLAYSLGMVDVASYIGKTKLDILNWQNNANINGANIKLIFNETYGEKGTVGTIMSQSIKNDFVTIGTTINLGISKGMKIATPDFSGKTESECITIGKDNGLSILFDYQYSNTIGKGYVINQSPAKDTVITDEKQISIVISLSGTASDNIVVPDFLTMKSNTILQWGQDNGVIINLYKISDDFISPGSVISQSIAKNTVIKKNSSITVYVSAGATTAVEYVSVPSFQSMSENEASIWAKSNNITLSTSEKYSDSTATGILLSQNIASGNVIAAGSEIKLSYSLGKIEVASYIGKTKLDILNWQKDVNAKGANITLVFTNGYGEAGSANKIISQSINNELVNIGSTITIIISEGMKIVVPDFSGMTEAQCASASSGIGLPILFNYSYSSSVLKGLEISQSIDAGKIVTDADAIIIYISLGATTP